MHCSILQKAAHRTTPHRWIIVFAASVAAALTLLPAVLRAAEEDRRGRETVFDPNAVRAVVDEWLAHVGANRTKEMFDLTTRETGGAASVDLQKTWAFKSIRAAQVLGDDIAAMVRTTQFKDNAGRLRALLFSLVHRESRWLIRDHFEDSPENIQRRIEGFATYPGIKYHARPEDLAGEWRSGFLIQSQYTFRPDGSGEKRALNPENNGRVTPFRWKISGDVFRLEADNKVSEGKIIRLEPDFFGVGLPDGTAWGYERVTARE